MINSEATSLMKRMLCLLLLITLLPLPALAQETPAAEEIDIVWSEGKRAQDQDALRDGLDDTATTLKRGATAELTATLPEDTAASQLYVRTDTLCARAELQYLNEKRKWETVAALDEPGVAFVLRCDTPVAGRLRLLLTNNGSTAVRLTELRLFGEGPLPASLAVWTPAEKADVLAVADSLETLDTEALAEWLASGRSVAVALLGCDSPLAASDALWAAGLRVQPALGGNASDAVKTVTRLIRRYQPMLLITLGDAAAQAAPEASANAADYHYELADAAQLGLWVVSRCAGNVAEAASRLANLGERNTDALRAACAQPFAAAQHGDPAAIPYPDNRLADGYLPEGEFLFEDEEQGLWAYLSATLQVEIVRYEEPDVPRVWFVTDLRFKPEQERFGQVVYNKASFKNQQTYPQTLAQNANLVLAVNGDYYPYRVEHKYPIGNILRNYEVLYDYDNRKSRAYPNLDTLALRDDGTLSVYDSKEITASELAAQGDVHDALSFGPYLARDGRLRIYDGSDWNAVEPRSAVGMIEAGHYRFLTVEGRIPKGPAGMNINDLALLMYAQGVTDAFNLDGGSTAVLIFMGNKLNVTGKGTTIGSPRNMHELFGIGSSPLTHTEWLNGKPKK